MFYKELPMCTSLERVFRISVVWYKRIETNNINYKIIFNALNKLNIKNEQSGLISRRDLLHSTLGNERKGTIEQQRVNLKKREIL